MAAATDYLLPLQVGVNVPSATEIVAKNVKLWTHDAAANEVILQVDMRNAFNSVVRCNMLAEVKARVPQLYPYTTTPMSFLATGTK